MNKLAILNRVLENIPEEKRDDWCCVVYMDVDRMGMFMLQLVEQDGRSTVHSYMKELQLKLAEQLGYFPRMSHNSPTDGNILIFMDESSPKLTDCCKESFLSLYKFSQKHDYTGYHSAAFKMLASIEDRLCESIVDKLNPDEEFVNQLIRIEYGQ